MNIAPSSRPIRVTIKSSVEERDGQWYFFAWMISSNAVISRSSADLLVSTDLDTPTMIWGPSDNSGRLDDLRDYFEHEARQMFHAYAVRRMDTLREIDVHIERVEDVVY